MTKLLQYAAKAHPETEIISISQIDASVLDNIPVLFPNLQIVDISELKAKNAKSFSDLDASISKILSLKLKEIKSSILPSLV